MIGVEWCHVVGGPIISALRGECCSSASVVSWELSRESDREKLSLMVQWKKGGL